MIEEYQKESGEQIEAETQRQKTIIRELVAPLIDTTALRDGQLGKVEIAILPSALGGEVASGLGGVSMPMQVVFGDGGQTLKNIGLVVLSLLTLAVMFLMVRRSTSVAAVGVPSKSELTGAPPSLHIANAEILGDVDESTPALVGVELDEEALRRRQMLEQLNQLVESEPTEVANLLRRWMRSDT